MSAKERVALFYVVGARNDSPIFMADYSSTSKPDQRHLYDFVLHASLDAVDELLKTSTHAHLGRVDSFNDLIVSAWVCCNSVKLLLLHSGHVSDDALKPFFASVDAFIARTSANPMRALDAPISSPEFARLVRKEAVTRKLCRA